MFSFLSLLCFSSWVTCFLLLSATLYSWHLAKNTVAMEGKSSRDFFNTIYFSFLAVAWNHNSRLDIEFVGHKFNEFTADSTESFFIFNGKPFDVCLKCLFQKLLEIPALEIDPASNVKEDLSSSECFLKVFHLSLEVILLTPTSDFGITHPFSCWHLLSFLLKMSIDFVCAVQYFPSWTLHCFNLLFFTPSAQCCCWYFICFLYGTCWDVFAHKSVSLICCFASEKFSWLNPLFVFQQLK